VTGPFSTIVYFGLPSPEDLLKIPVLDAIQSERTIRFAWLAPLVWDNVIHAVGAEQVDLSPIITNRFKLDELEDAIKYMAESKDPKIKGVVIFD
jgi:L-iditol 2-dehydrogenase